jgi:hypothetical protein
MIRAILIVIGCLLLQSCDPLRAGPFSEHLCTNCDDNDARQLAKSPHTKVTKVATVSGRNR